MTQTLDPDLTPRRAQVLGVIARARRPVTAYDILAALKDEGVTAPPTVYRALRFLVESGRVHRVERLNAYVACAGTDHGPDRAHPSGFMICRVCGTVEEIVEPGFERLARDTAGRAGFALEGAAFEAVGRCRACPAGS